MPGEDPERSGRGAEEEEREPEGEGGADRETAQSA
jgi:hypothetical protein